MDVLIPTIVADDKEFSRDLEIHIIKNANRFSISGYVNPGIENGSNLANVKISYKIQYNKPVLDIKSLSLSITMAGMNVVNNSKLTSLLTIKPRGITVKGTINNKLVDKFIGWDLKQLISILGY